jgi:hypothetical protein
VTRRLAWGSFAATVAVLAFAILYGAFTDTRPAGRAASWRA